MGATPLSNRSRCYLLTRTSTNVFPLYRARVRARALYRTAVYIDILTNQFTTASETGSPLSDLAGGISDLLLHPLDNDPRL